MIKGSLTCSLALLCSLVWRISLLDSCQTMKKEQRDSLLHTYMNAKRHKHVIITLKLTRNDGRPELLGVVLFYLCPLLHKLYVTLQQVEARLCVLVDVIILVLREEQHTETLVSIHAYAHKHWRLLWRSSRTQLTQRSLKVCGSVFALWSSLS